MWNLSQLRPPRTRADNEHWSEAELADAWEERRYAAHYLVDCCSRHVRVVLNGVTVADSHQPRILFETGLPPRYYLPVEDVRTDLLERVQVRTGCAYKGYASYWDVRTENGRIPAAAWTYSDPLREGEQIRDLVCFFQERPEIDVTVDGAPAESPRTPWSNTNWIDAARQRP